MKPKTFDGHNINDGGNYSARFPAEGGHWGLPEVGANLVERSGQWPVVSGLRRKGLRIAMEIEIVNLANLVDKRDELLGWLDVDEPAALVITDADGSSRERFVYAQPVRVIPRSDVMAQVYVVLVQIHGDVKWRAVTADTDSWSITASGDTKVVNNQGDAEALPVLTIEPTSSKTGAFSYKRWVPVRNRLNAALVDYPYDLTDGGLDTAALVTGSKAQADGDDFRVTVDGLEVNRWFGTGANAFNQATTTVWANLDLSGKVSLTLKTAIAGAGDVDTIELDSSINALPDAGIVLIDSEAFTYTSKNNTDRTLNNCTRAAKGTSMAAHSASTAVYWIEHDIWFVYGNAAASAPTVDDNYQPAFNLGSSNTSWDYDEFGEDDGKRTGAWYSGRDNGSPIYYNGNRGAAADPWAEIGIHIDEGEDGSGAWILYHPAGITNANFQNGEQYRPTYTSSLGTIWSSLNGIGWTVEYWIPGPGAAATWSSWSRNEALASGSKYVCLLSGGWPDTYMEAADVTITLNSSNVPTTLFIGGEQGNYELACTIENQATGESIQVTYNMALNEELEVDTDAKVLTDLEDNSNQFQALSLVGGARRDWLALDPGNNTLEFTDVGTGNVTIGLEWRKRWR